MVEKTAQLVMWVLTVFVLPALLIALIWLEPPQPVLARSMMTALVLDVAALVVWAAS